MGKLQFSMDGYRNNMVSDMNEMRQAIMSVFDDVCNDDREELIDKFDQVACNVNSLNYVSIEGMDSFSDMSESPQVSLLGDYEE